jgi:phosphatidylglycerol---prolipoprotein diacylglyceryl transferase
MHPILTVLHLGEQELPIASYGVMLCLAIAIASGGALHAAHRARLDIGACIAACGVAIAGAFAGAALLHAVVQGIRLGSPSALLLPPGLAFFGAALGGAGALALSRRGLGLDVLAVADRAVPAFCIAHAVGRIGCFLGGCCHGGPSDGPLAVTYTHPLAPAAALARPVHPLPLYEGAALMLLASVFALVPVREAGSGRRVLQYAAAYSVLRLGLEPLRGDAVRGLFFGGALSTSQLIAAAVLLAAAILYPRASRHAKQPA